MAYRPTRWVNRYWVTFPSPFPQLTLMPGSSSMVFQSRTFPAMEQAINSCRLKRTNLYPRFSFTFFKASSVGEMGKSQTTFLPNLMMLLHRKIKTCPKNKLFSKHTTVVSDQCPSLQMGQILPPSRVSVSPPNLKGISWFPFLRA